MDPTETPQADPALLDMLTSTDLTNVDTSMPLLQPGIYLFLIQAYEIKKTKDQMGDLLKFTLQLEQPAKTVKGADAVPGKFKIFHNINLTPKGNMTVEMRDQSLARFKEGVNGSKAGTFGHPESYIGRKVMCQLTITPPKGEYPEAQNITKFIHVA